ncbi:MAG: hypothetical protein FWF52_01020 [Candidatus Azobacteroides sp.]|nr:hypothetical protein [Candidatus Azobacteroides sp.]
MMRIFSEIVRRKKGEKKCLFLSMGSLLFFFLFFACTSSDSVDYGLGEYYVEITTALGDNAFLLDSGKTIQSVGGETGRSYEAGDRVFLNFSYIEGSADQITIHASAKIVLGTLTPVEEKDIEAFANDPIRLESAWIGDHYLNLRIYMEYQSEKHKIGLFTDKERLDQPEIIVYFLHDANNDPPGYPTSLYLSFDLEGALGEPEGNKILQIHFNTTNYGQKIYELNY